MAALAPAMQLAPVDHARLRACIQAHTPAVWRVLRRNGVPVSDMDDAVQRVFLILSKRLSSVEAGSERPFILRTATFIASETRRCIRRRRESPDSVPELLVDDGAPPEEAYARREAVDQLDRLLDALDGSLRAVFVLYEIEELTMAQIAETLELAPGTVASRLRRARVRFEELCAALRQGEP